MSYDLRIITTRQPEPVVVSDFLSSRRGHFLIDGNLEVGSGNLMVSAEKRGASVPIFTLDGPFKVEIEDIDDPLVGLVLAPQWLTEISIPAASTQSELKLARSLGVQLAKSFQGAIYDPQEDSVLWPKRRPKLYKTPQVAESINVIKLRWYLPYSKRDSHTAKLFVEFARKYLYECLPRRFGLFEPFQGKVKDDDYTGFYLLWQEAAAKPYGDILHFSSTAPCYGGSASFSDPRDDMPRNVGAEKVVKLQVDIDGRAMSDPAWRDAVTTLFTNFSRKVGSFYAIGYVERGIETKGRSLYYTGSSESYPLPRHNRWLGLPPVPAWLTWFGHPYNEAVRDSCKKHITEEYDAGFLIRKTTEPSDIETLAPDFPAFPVNLQAKLSEQTLSSEFASIFGANVLPSDDRMTDRAADLILPLE
ncbi:MAG: hypothetical protein HKN77_08895 [Woeseiaceae bacterium]|nr:hypothetical protein [Woeseiaceae bacterium]